MATSASTYFGPGGVAYTPYSTSPIGPSKPGYVQGTADRVPISSTTPTSGNSGGSGSSGSTNTGSNNPFDNIQPSGPSQEEINAQFNPIFDVYNQAERNLRDQQPGLISEAEAQAAASRQLLENSKTNQNELLGQQAQRVQSTGENQTAQQRQILQELGLANQQRFGGASSAGQAASEIQGREFQRSRYGIQQNVQQGLQTIDQQKVQVQREYDQGLQQLEVNKQQAINEINRKFQDKLLEINARRGETEAAKAAARMSALQDLRNQAYQINVARAQFEADLRTQAQSNLSYLTQAQQSLLSYGQAGVAAGDTATSYQALGLPRITANTGNGTTNPTYQGMISNKDELTGSIIPTGTNDSRYIGGNLLYNPYLTYNSMGDQYGAQQ